MFARERAGGVTGGDVSDFMGDDSGQFGFIISGEDESTVDVKKSAGEAVGAGDVSGVDDFDGEGYFGVGEADEFLGEAVDVVVDGGIGNGSGQAIKRGGKVVRPSSCSRLAE